MGIAKSSPSRPPRRNVARRVLDLAAVEPQFVSSSGQGLSQGQRQFPRRWIVRELTGLKVDRSRGHAEKRDRRDHRAVGNQVRQVHVVRKRHCQ